jgi:RNA 2',3'-cyclic 3'-phosphodiesterase
MTLLRVFIAVEIPLTIRKAILEKTESMRNALGTLIRWVPVENMHFTLKFIGEVSPGNVELLSEMLTLEAKGSAPFPMQVGGLGSFPGPRRARVIWIGIQSPAALVSLQHGIESATARLGYEPETRSFSPHLTIGRVRQQVSAGEQQQIRAALEKTQVGDLGKAEITEVHLFKSDLQPGGPIYTRLFSVPLEKTSSLNGMTNKKDEVII